MGKPCTKANIAEEPSNMSSTEDERTSEKRKLSEMDIVERFVARYNKKVKKQRGKSCWSQAQYQRINLEIEEPRQTQRRSRRNRRTDSTTTTIEYSHQISLVYTTLACRRYRVDELQIGVELLCRENFPFTMPKIIITLLSTNELLEYSFATETTEKTSLLHPNINANGELCICSCDDSDFWSPVLAQISILTCIIENIIISPDWKHNCANIPRSSLRHFHIMSQDHLQRASLLFDWFMKNSDLPRLVLDAIVTYEMCIDLSVRRKKYKIITKPQIL